MSNILNIDCSDATMYISISNSGNVLAEKHDTIQLNHAANLQLNVQEVLNQSSLNFIDLSAVAVMNGPGSYTGLRVALSAAKAYTFALNIPLISICNLQSIAMSFFEQYTEFQHPICAAISPMKNELIVACYSKTLDCLFSPIHFQINNPKLQEILQDYSLCGSELVNNSENSNINHFYNINFNKTNINRLSNDYFIKKDFENTISIEPYYIKMPYIN